MPDSLCESDRARTAVLAMTGDSTPRPIPGRTDLALEERPLKERMDEGVDLRTLIARLGRGPG